MISLILFKYVLLISLPFFHPPSKIETQEILITDNLLIEVANWIVLETPEAQLRTQPLHPYMSSRMRGESTIYYREALHALLHIAGDYVSMV